jgi:hypothetical protein
MHMNYFIFHILNKSLVLLMIRIKDFSYYCYRIFQEIKHSKSKPDSFYFEY